MQRIKCEIREQYSYSEKKRIKIAVINDQTIYDKNFEFVYDDDGLAQSCRIVFKSCVMNCIPSSESIIKYFPYLTEMAIFNTKLSKITAEDLMGYECLRELIITGCDIEYLPSNLFKYMRNLEVVSFYGNKIKYIGEGMLDPLKKLKFFNLKENPNINVKYDILFNKGNVTLEQLKDEIKQKCQLYSEHKLSLEIEKQKKEIVELKTQNEELKKSNDELKKRFDDMEKKFTSQLENAKDFTVKVGQSKFKVNKIVLMAQSKVLENLINENPEADSLNLEDISKATFEEILNFMTDKIPPNENANLIELFSASCLLQIGPLSTIIADRLMNKLNPENAFEVLSICNKYKNYRKLRLKALAEYSKSI